MKFLILVMTAAMQYAWTLPAFPGAEGWGSETPAGRGGKVLIVTNTNASGSGSFSAALKSTGKRIIVFRVSGVIPGEMEVTGTNNDYTIAGQTSPGGVTIGQIWNYGNVVNNFAVRFVRFRSPGSEHAFEAYNSTNFILDHCDFSGGCDEDLDLCGCSDFSVQWCTIANSPARPACQNYGLLIAYQKVKHVTLHHLLFANHTWRFPEMHWLDAAPTDYGMTDYRNNVLYNGTDIWFSVGSPFGEVHYNVVGNYFKAGPNTPSDGKVYSFDNVKVYSSDNVFKTGNAVTGNVTTPWTMPAVTTETAANAYNSVLNKAGAWPRDAMNIRTVNEVRTGTGQFGKMDDALITTGPAAPADADNDGMPDFWETAMGFSPNDSAGKNADHDGDGYTNIEEYLNDLALARMCQDYYNPVYPIPSNWGDYNPTCCKPLEVEQHRGSLVQGGYIAVFPSIYCGTGTLRIELRTPDVKMTGKLNVTGLDGRICANLPVKESVQWDGRDNNGLPLAAGIYLVQWKGNGGQTLQKRLTIIR